MGWICIYAPRHKRRLKHKYLTEFKIGPSLGNVSNYEGDKIRRWPSRLKHERRFSDEVSARFEGLSLPRHLILTWHFRCWKRPNLNFNLLALACSNRIPWYSFSNFLSWESVSFIWSLLIGGHLLHEFPEPRFSFRPSVDIHVIVCGPHEQRGGLLQISTLLFSPKSANLIFWEAQISIRMECAEGPTVVPLPPWAYHPSPSVDPRESTLLLLN